MKRRALRIGLSTSVIQRGRTGVAQHVFALTKAFCKLAGNYEFVLFVLEKDLPLFSSVESFMQLVAVPECFRPPVLNILWHQIELPRLVRQHQIDVLHVPSYRRLLWRRPSPLVATVHDLAPFRVPKKYDWMRMTYARVIVRRLIRRQNEIIAVSQTTARDLQRFCQLPSERIHVIHNGVDHERFHPGPRDQAQALVAKRYGIETPFFLYVARLEHPGKNHVRLIAAFTQFKSETRSPWPLVLAGSDWHGAEIIHAAIRASPVAADIRCLGFVSDSDLPTLHQAAEVFVYPSLFEGFGMPPIEAMACGCPVISSTRGALGEVIGDAAATVDPEDVPMLKWQLARLANDAGLREHLRSAGLVQAQKFRWEKSAEATMEIYARAAAKPKLSRAVSGFSRWKTVV